MFTLILFPGWLACKEPEPPPPECVVHIPKSITFNADAGTCDAELITIENIGDLPIYCSVAEVSSTCVNSPFQLEEPGITLGVGLAYSALVEWCPDEAIACAATLLITCIPDTADEVTCTDQDDAHLLLVDLLGAAGSPDLDDDGYTIADGDCAESEPTIYPGALERENRADDDCDTLVDEGTGLFDDDGDGFSEWEGDCSDSDGSLSPTAQETPDLLDEDCDGWVDEGTVLFDDDGDGYSEVGPGAEDCDDWDQQVHPGATELADGIDQDCDGKIDEGTTLYDDDADSWTEVEGDCDDRDPTTFPYAAEVPDRADNDCDSVTDEGTILVDDDGDGYSEVGGDCDDSNASLHPGAYDDPNTPWVDENCDKSYTD